jgi:hypothetical protein
MVHSMSITAYSQEETGMLEKLSVRPPARTMINEIEAPSIELVLRRPDGAFLPTFWVMSTLCHEVCLRHPEFTSGSQSNN